MVFSKSFSYNLCIKNTKPSRPMTLSDLPSAPFTMSSSTSSNVIQNAAAAVSENKMHVRIAACLYNNSYEILRRHACIYADGDAQSRGSRREQNWALIDGERKIIVGALLSSADTGTALSWKEVKSSAAHFFSLLPKERKKGANQSNSLS